MVGILAVACVNCIALTFKARGPPWWLGEVVSRQGRRRVVVNRRDRRGAADPCLS